MDSFLTMERFIKMRGHLITPLFSVLPLNHDFEFDKIKHGPLQSLASEIKYIQENIKLIGEEEKISRLFKVVTYGLYIYAIDLSEIINKKTFISQKLYHKFISLYLRHRNINQIDQEKYLDLCRNNRDIMLESNTLGRFENLLRDEGFDHKTFNLSAIFLILFWANLENLAQTIKGKIFIARNSMNELCEVIRDEIGVDETALLNMEVSQIIKDCTECHMLLHYTGKFFIQNGSPEMEYIESIGKNKVIKSTQVKGGKSKGETGKKIIEATIFFWKKCLENNPNLLAKSFSEALYSLSRNTEDSNHGVNKIKDFIKNLGEKERISVLSKSKAKPKAIAARLTKYNLIRNTTISD